MKDEPEEQVVVPLGDTCAQPDAVVVESDEAVVAQVAVRGSQGSEDVAGLTEFELEHNRLVSQIPLQIEHSVRRFYVCILIRQASLFYTQPSSARQDAWVSGCRAEHEVVCDDQ